MVMMVAMAMVVMVVMVMMTALTATNMYAPQWGRVARRYGMMYSALKR
jgi:hypothetical protein